jgi:hypothetical protein
MSQPSFAWWISPRRALDLGCTHHARIFGIVPGFVGLDDGGGYIWVSRGDWLNLIEDACSHVFNTFAALSGADEISPFVIGREIKGQNQ